MTSLFIYHSAYRCMRLNVVIICLSIALAPSLLASFPNYKKEVQPKRDRTRVTTQCGYGFDRFSKTVDASRCFVGDLCCCDYDAFDFADRLLSEEETVLTGRIEEVQGLPDTLLVRRDVLATIFVDQVFRGSNTYESSEIVVKLSSDMFVWEESSQSRIVARQALISDHEDRVRSILDQFRALDQEKAVRKLSDERYKSERSHLEKNLEDLGQLRWYWEGELGVITAGKDGPVPGCENGVFTTDRYGALSIGETYLFALDQPSKETDVDFALAERAEWKIFDGEEMDDVVRALTYTTTCLSWPEIVVDPEEEFVAISICSDWARGQIPTPIKRRH